MNRVRVLHTVGNLELGGGQKLVALVAGALNRESFEVAVLSFGPPGPYGRRLRALGVPVIDLGLVRPLGKNRPSTLLRAAVTLVRTVVFGRWDIVHTHMFLSSVVVTPLARLGQARVFGTTHRIYYGRVQPIVERLVAVLQERIVVDSAAVGEILRARTHIPRDKYVVIHNGIDRRELDSAPSREAALAVLGLPGDATVIGEVAHLVRHKGQRILIQAFASLAAHRPGLWLLLVGDGPDAEALREMAATLGVSDRTVLTGALDDLPTVLAVIDVLALPSTFEGFGIVQAEAMYLRKPVVATSYGGSTEVVEHGVTGFLVPFGDVDGLAEHLETLVDSPELRAEMGKAARRRVLKQFTAEHMAARYRVLYTGEQA